MIALKSLLPKCDAPSILCLGAHCDDIEIGCGGTILRILEECPDATVVWIAFSSHGHRRAEADDSARRFLAAASKAQVEFHDFRDGYFPYQGDRIKDVFEEIKGAVTPDIVFTHRLEDRHQDHRLISELTWNTFRNHLILEYEIPKFEGDLGLPNVFVGLTSAVLDRKVSILVECFRSQADKYWFRADAFRALPTIRGIETGPRYEFAEAFYCRKLVL